MMAWHGTDRSFQQFDKAFIGTGEGAAKRGHGFNFALDEEVARFYAARGASEEGVVIGAIVPDEEYLLDLDAPIENRKDLVIALHEALGFDRHVWFDEAAEHDDISMSYPDDRAEAMFERLLINQNDRDAMEELQQWSPGYDWDALKRRLDDNAIEFDAANDTLNSLYTAAAIRLGGPEAANDWLLDQGIVGTIGHEPLSEGPEESPRSVVVFNAGDIKILTRESVPAEPDPGAPSPW